MMTKNDVLDVLLLQWYLEQDSAYQKQNASYITTFASPNPSMHERKIVIGMLNELKDEGLVIVEKGGYWWSITQKAIRLDKIGRGPPGVGGMSL